MQLDCYITLLYDHDNRYHFSFSFSLQKLLQHCMYLYGHANKAGCCGISHEFEGNFGYKYLLLTELKGRTVSYGRIFPIDLYHKSKGKNRGSVTYSTDLEGEVSKIFIISLLCLTANDFYSYGTSSNF